MPTSIEAQGVTIEEAIQVALNQLGVTRDRVEIEIIHHPRTGFLGLGARRARVKATVREAFLADGEEYDMSSGEKIGRGSRRGRRSRRRKGRRPDGPEEAESVRRAEPREAPREAPREQREPRSREQRAETPDRDRRRRGGGRGRDGEREGRSAPGGGESQRRSDGDRRRAQAGGRERGGAPAPVVRPAVDSPVERAADREPEGVAAAAPSRSAAPQEIRQHTPEAISRRPPTAPMTPGEQVRLREDAQPRAATLATELLQRMGFQAQVSARYDQVEQEVVVTVESDAEGLLIGRRGQTLDAIEHVLNRMVLSGESATELRIALDVGGYRDRRRDTLLELADRLKVRALTQGRRIQVSPMSPRDRRILQGVLGRDDTVRTRVLGTGFYRRVVIFPVGLEEDSMPMENEDDQGSETVTTTEEDGA